MLFAAVAREVINSQQLLDTFCLADDKHIAVFYVKQATSECPQRVTRLTDGQYGL